ncbi:sulfite exporter TauE/SafE family protein [Haliea sp. E17]|uniref:sulfite exporter TauE/SafE family protein n=1 Tax=Haliea sp. E17 TaxID=3401576 RepID=UPI003AAD8E04
MTESALFTAFGLGLAGAGHCLGMCGGIAAALNLGANARPLMTFAYHGGRIASYTLLGALFGLAAGSIDLGLWTLGLRILAGLLLVGMGLSICGWTRGMLPLEQAGSYLWRPVQRFSSRLLPLQYPWQAAGLGLCWGLMPCGLIYSSLAWAATAQSAGTAALLMFCFGIGTLPAMLATSLGAQRLQTFLRRRQLRRLLGVLVIASGLWTLYVALAHGGHFSAAQPASHGTMHHH